ncbi:TIGR02206 family membrane protein [uncultured Solobacterium sp.]|uniref:YwaF family protein n=1 Tax=uncultured Solobacterium sp. TaxID=747375 RepID=UPI0028DB43A1|nr:TIGR02206 family membrane protein [uncultured Solobacterium sp.]
MTYFFRYEPDGVHNMSIFIIRIVFIAVLLFAYTQKQNKKLLQISLLLGLFLQAALFIWYSGNPLLFMKEGLPLYHCRLSAIMLAVSYFLKKEKWVRYFAWLGLVGAIIAFSFPDPSPFLWPHITNITYIGSHILLGLTAVIILCQEKTELNMKDIFLYTVAMNLVISFVNHFMGSNYGYLKALPKMFPYDFMPIQLFFILSVLISVIIIVTEKTYLYIHRFHHKNVEEDIII